MLDIRDAAIAAIQGIADNPPSNDPGICLDMAIRAVSAAIPAASPAPAAVTEAAVEAAADAMWLGLCGDIRQTEIDKITYRDTATSALLAAIPLLSPSMGWELKPLVWTWIEANLRYDAWEAQSLVGRYTTPRVDGTWQLWRAAEDEDIRLGVYETDGEAKAAAQADYEARISSTLPPANGEGR